MRSVFSVDNLANDKPVNEDNKHRAWDGAKYGRIVDRFTEDGIRYVVVNFDAPGDPPSNYIDYIYLAP